MSETITQSELSSNETKVNGLLSAGGASEKVPEGIRMDFDP